MKKSSGSSDVNHVSFNQDFSCIAIGTRSGFSIYNLDPIELRYNSSGEGIGRVEMLYCTSLLALVGSGDQPGSSPRKFKLWNSQNKEMICEITFPSTVLKIVLNRERVVVCLETQIHVYDLASMKCLQVLSIAPNPSGLVALSTEPSSYLVFPSGTGGGIVLYDCITLRLLSQIDAHKSPIAAVHFNSTGTILATASTSGTVIRLFAVPSGSHLCTFRRGSRPAVIYSLSFSQDSTVLAVASSSGTVHIFDVVHGMKRASHSHSSRPQSNGHPSSSESRSRSDDSRATEQSGWRDSVTTSALSYINMAQTWGMAAVGQLNVLPEPMQEFADSIRAVALARLPATALSGPFRAGIVRSVPTTADEQKGSAGDEDPGLKVVVVTPNKLMFRYAVPRNISELTSQQKIGEDFSAVECTLEDEAVLEL